jgi:hypothetical protein
MCRAISFTPLRDGEEINLGSDAKLARGASTQKPTINEVGNGQDESQHSRCALHYGATITSNTGLKAGCAVSPSR